MRSPADLLALLASGGWIDEPTAERVRREARRRGVAEVTALLEVADPGDAAILHVLQEAVGLEVVDPGAPDAVDLDALRWLRQETAEAHLVLPLAVLPDGEERTLRLAMADPLARGSVAAVEQEAGLVVTPVIAPARAVQAAIARHYGRVRTQVIAPRPTSRPPAPARWLPPGPEVETEPLHRLEDEASPAQLVQALVNLLAKRGLIDRDAFAEEVRALLRGESR